jgi:hypothetical protein
MFSFSERFISATGQPRFLDLGLSLALPPKACAMPREFLPVPLRTRRPIRAMRIPTLGLGLPIMGVGGDKNELNSHMVKH